MSDDDRPWDVVERVVSVRRPLDLVATLSPLRQGRRDPTATVEPGRVWRATRTPAGPACQLLVTGPAAGEVRVRAWGPGAAWLLDAAPDLVGVNDRTDDFQASRHPVVADLWRRHPGLAIPKTRAVFEILAPTICAQKVTGIEARQSWFSIARRWGVPAPRPRGRLDAAMPRLVLPPAPAELATLGTHVLHRIGLEHKRAATLIIAAGAAARLESAADLGRDDARRQLEALPGIGRWTSAEVAIVAFGDADAVSVGDYHLPNVVTWALAGEPRGDDTRMLELLEPFRGHRGRVVRLLGHHPRPPRRGPRMPVRGFQDQ